MARLKDNLVRYVNAVDKPKLGPRVFDSTSVGIAECQS